MSDRHEKWTPVEAGYVVPKGQMYRMEVPATSAYRAAEYVSIGFTVPQSGDEWFIDSSWRPPLVLPTEPTWGIAVCDARLDDRKPLAMLADWFMSPVGSPLLTNHSNVGNVPTSRVLDFIPLTDEQVLRIESHHE